MNWPKNWISGIICISDSHFEGFNFTGSLICFDLTEENFKSIRELKKRGNLVEGHIPEVDAGKLKEKIYFYVNFPNIVSTTKNDGLPIELRFPKFVTHFAVVDKSEYSEL